MIKAGWMINYIRMDLLDWKQKWPYFMRKRLGGTSYDGPLGEVPPERDSFLKHQVYAVLACVQTAPPPTPLRKNPIFPEGRGVLYTG